MHIAVRQLLHSLQQFKELMVRLIMNLLTEEGSWPAWFASRAEFEAMYHRSQQTPVTMAGVN